MKDKTTNEAFRVLWDKMGEIKGARAKWAKAYGCKRGAFVHFLKTKGDTDAIRRALSVGVEVYEGILTAKKQKTDTIAKVYELIDIDFF